VSPDAEELKAYGVPEIRGLAAARFLGKRNFLQQWQLE
jgi:hypothetical protein